tara:strand:+ start:24954 stop:25703 length:750 start_codon:yes stop_codon:yes gene_type:complete
MRDNYLNELKREGIVVIENFLTKSKCNHIIGQIEDFSIKEKVIEEKDEGLGGDIRIFGFEKFSDEVLKFSKNNVLKKMVSDYSNLNLETKSTLAGKVIYENDKQTNSGGDWHRDAELQELKAMLYLSDVNSENGPFCFIKGSKDFDFERRNKKYTFFRKILFAIKGLPSKPPRYKNSLIIKNSETVKKIIKVTGKAGTLVVFDGSYIHRGDVIRSGTRYSITNYYSPILKKGIISSIKNITKKILLKEA